MKQMKWIISIFLAIGMLVGCGTSAPEKNQKAASKEEVKSTETAKTEEQSKAEEQTKQEEVKQEEKKDQVNSTESKSTTSSENKSTSSSENKKQEGKATTSAGSAPATSSSEQSAPSQSPAPQPAPKPTPPPTPVANTVTISITGDKGMGTVLGKTEVEIKEGDTVFNVLAYITKKKRIQMEYIGVGKTIYVQGINNLYEKDLGSGSGWMYRVNGVFPNESAGVHKVKSGDLIEWLYTLNLGKDIGGGW